MISTNKFIAWGSRQNYLVIPGKQPLPSCDKDRHNSSQGDLGNNMVSTGCLGLLQRG